MGSCSNKGNQKDTNSIKVVSTSGNGKKNTTTSVPNSESKFSNNLEDPHKNGEIPPEDRSKEKQKYTISIIKEENKERKGKKMLTVLSTNDDNLELPLDISNEMSLVKQRSIGKKEQGSLLLVKKPLLFGGRISLRVQSEFEEKVMSIEGDDVKREHLLEHGVWVACKKGLKPESPNQDDYVVMIDDHSTLLGVFDGHGTHGHEISNFIHKAFPRALLSHEHWLDNPIFSISESFPQVQNELKAFCENNPGNFDCILSGSTATLVHIRQNKLYVGHVGDSRAVMARRTGGKLVAVDLTRDHKPTLDDEGERIEKMGGEVRKIDNEPPYRVFFRNKQYPGIAMSRTMGDTLAQSIGVTCVAESNEFELQEGDEFVVACSDGVWEFISSQEAVEEIGKFGKDAKGAANALATLAWNRWVVNEDDVVDDITVIIAYLKAY